MSRLSLMFLSRFGAVAFLCGCAWIGWQNLGPRRPEIGAARKAAADYVISRIVEDIRTSRQSILRARLIHFENDPTEYRYVVKRLKKKRVLKTISGDQSNSSFNASLHTLPPHVNNSATFLTKSKRIRTIPIHENLYNK